MQDRFTSHEVIALTGITPRQLQWWDERGVVKPEREGHRRLYSMNHLTEVAVICELRRKGFSLQGVRKVMRFLDREFGKRLAEIVSRTSDYHLLTDGTHLYLETSARQIVDIPICTQGHALPRPRVRQTTGRNRQPHLRLSPADRRNASLSRDFRAPDRRHSEEFGSADSGGVPERRGAAGAGWGRLRKGEYFGNFA